MITIERVAGLAKIILAEAIMLFCLSGIVGNIVNGTGTSSCPPNGSALTPLLFCFSLVLGLFCALWLVTSILQPGLRQEGFQTTLRIGGISMPNPFLGPVAFPMVSTHPTYVFVDLLMVGTGILL